MEGNSSDCNFAIIDFERYGSDQTEVDCQSALKSLLKDNLNKVIFAHSNINPIKNKYNYFFEQIKGNIYISLVSETKKLMKSFQSVDSL